LPLTSFYGHFRDTSTQPYSSNEVIAFGRERESKRASEGENERAREPRREQRRVGSTSEAMQKTN